MSRISSPTSRKRSGAVPCCLSRRSILADLPNRSVPHSKSSNSAAVCSPSTRRTFSMEFELTTARRSPAAFSRASASGMPSNSCTLGSISCISVRTWAMMAGSFHSGMPRYFRISAASRWRSWSRSAASILRKPYLSATVLRMELNQGMVSARVPSKSKAARSYFKCRVQCASGAGVRRRRGGGGSARPAPGLPAAGRRPRRGPRRSTDSPAPAASRRPRRRRRRAASPWSRW